MSEGRDVYSIKDYRFVSANIANATVNQEIDLTGITALDVAVVNDGVGSIIVRYNSTANDPVTIKSGEQMSTTDFLVKKLFISNASGASVAVRVFFIGANVL